MVTDALFDLAPQSPAGSAPVGSSARPAVGDGDGTDGLEVFYQGRYATLYLGDALDVIPQVPQQMDLLCTDPPYGQKWQSSRRTKKFDRIAGDDGTLDVVDVLGLALKKLRRGRHVYCFGPADLSPLPVTARTELIWDKQIMGSGDLTSPWGPEHERIQFTTYEISKANREKGYVRLAARLRQGSVLSHPRPHGSGVVRHPTEKPVALMRALVEASSVVGETVFDPFAGVGSTLVAAVAAGRHAVGIELKAGYCEIAATRLAKIEALVAAMDGI